MSNLAPWSVLHVAVSHFDLASSCEKTVEIVFRFLCYYFIVECGSLSVNDRFCMPEWDKMPVVATARPSLCGMW